MLRAQWPWILLAASLLILAFVYAPWPLVPIPPLGIPLALAGLLGFAIAAIAIPARYRSRFLLAKVATYAIGIVYGLLIVIFAAIPPLFLLAGFIAVSVAPLDGEYREFRGEAYYVSTAWLAGPDTPGDARRVVAPLFMEREPSRSLYTWPDDGTAADSPPPPLGPSAAPTAEASSPTQPPSSAPASDSGGAEEQTPSAGPPPLSIPANQCADTPVPGENPDLEAEGAGGRYLASSSAPPCVFSRDLGGALVARGGVRTSGDAYSLFAPGDFVVLGTGRAGGGEVFVSADGGTTWIAPKFPEGLGAQVGMDGDPFLQGARIAQRQGREVLVLDLGLPRWAGEGPAVTVRSEDGGRTFILQ